MATSLSPKPSTIDSHQHLELVMDHRRDVSPSLSEIAVRKDPISAGERVIYIGDSANYRYVIDEVGDPFKGSGQSKYFIDNLQRDMIDQLGLNTQESLRTMRCEEEEQLRCRGAFQYPERTIRDDLVRVFFDYSYLACPVVCQATFMKLYKAENLSPLLLNAVLFMATIHCSKPLLESMGFPNRYLAGQTFYRRAKALYDADYESDGITTVQATILLSHRCDGPTEQKDTWHWLGIAAGLAQSLGMHRRLVLKMTQSNICLSMGTGSRTQFCRPRINCYGVEYGGCYMCVT